MISILKYGTNSQLELDLAPEMLVTNCESPAKTNLEKVQSAERAVAEPLNFPPIKQAIVPGDHIVLALSPAVPQATDVVAAIIPILLEGGVTGEDVTVIQTADDVEAGLPDPRSKLPENLRNSVQLFTHNPDEQTQLSYLAADAQGEPIYLNRRMCEADFVIPIGCLWPVEAVQRNGSKHIWNETIYPTFGDRKTIERLSPSGIPQSKGQIAHRLDLIDQMAWLLGVHVTAQVVPGGNGQYRQVFVGSPEQVFQEGRRLCRQVWQHEVPRQVSLVIACLSGGSTQQTWENVGRALEAALRVVKDGGAVVICTELDELPGPALKQLASAADLEAIQHRLRKLHSSDASLARLLAQSLDRVSIFLLSKLKEDVVASLGFAHIANPSEINRLAAHHDSCLLLADAQYAVPTVIEE